MADYGACPSVPVPVMEVLLGASSEHRPMLLLLPPCLAALASIKSEMEQQTIVAATRPLDRFPLLAAAVKERLQQLLEEVVAECREKLEEFIQEKESFFIDIGWPATFVYPTVPLGVRVAGSDRWDGASKRAGPGQGPSTGGTRLVGQDEWEPTTGLEELKRYYGGVQEGRVRVRDLGLTRTLSLSLSLTLTLTTAACRRQPSRRRPRRCTAGACAPSRRRWRRGCARSTCAAATPSCCARASRAAARP